MMKRWQVVKDIENLLLGEGLNEVYGVETYKTSNTRGRPFSNTTFCKAWITDGWVQVYSEKFIVVKWYTRRRDLPTKGSELFRSLETAKVFITDFFGNKHDIIF